MQLLTTIFAIATLLLGFVLAARLLRLALRTRKAPELAMGFYCLFISVGAFFYGLAFRNGPMNPSPSAPLLSAVSTLLIGIAAFALAIGIWKIFYSANRWGLVAVAGVGLMIGTGWVASVLPGRPVLLGDFTPANAVFVAGRVAVYGFGAFAAFRYASMLRRRAALGLGDLVTAHQIGLWGVAWVCVAMIGLGSITTVGIGGVEAFQNPYAPLLVSGLNAAAWVCTWLSFFPPASYQRWVAGAASEASA